MAISDRSISEIIDETVENHFLLVIIIIFLVRFCFMTSCSIVIFDREIELVLILTLSLTLLFFYQRSLWCYIGFGQKAARNLPSSKKGMVKDKLSLSISILKCRRKI